MPFVTVLTRSLVLGATLSAPCAAQSSDYQSVTKNDGPPMLGIEMSPPPSSALQNLNLGSNTGVYVQNIFPGTAAAAMGIKPGDVIVSVNGTDIHSMSDLRNEIGLGTVGDPVQVQVVRSKDESIALAAPLQEWPANIPRENIDPASERRFRDWQNERMKAQQAQVDELKDKAAALHAKLPSLPEATDQARLAELASRLATESWQFDRSIASTALVASATDVPASVAVDGAASSDAWHFRYRMGAPEGAAR